MRSVLSVSLPENISSELDKFARSTGRTVVGGIALTGGMLGWSSGMLASPTIRGIGRCSRAWLNPG